MIVLMLKRGRLLGCKIILITLYSRDGVEDARLEAKAKDTKKSEVKAKDNHSEDRPLDAKDRNARDQGRMRRWYLRKKVFKNFFQAIS